MNKTLIVAKREYLKVIRKPSFWISTLFFPIFIIVISLISGFSSAQLEDRIKSESENAKAILVLDEAGFLSESTFNSKIIKVNNLDESIKRVMQQEVDALIYYPSNLLESKEIKIYSQDKGLFLNESFNSFAINLLKQNILQQNLSEINQLAYSSTYSFSIKSYKDGKESNVNFANLIIPGISLAIYFILTTFAVSYLLLSVSEEKENRVMEIVLSSISAKSLISGKIIGLVGVIFTQVIVLIILSILGLILATQLFFQNSAFLNSFLEAFKSISLEPSQIVLQIILGVFFTFTGFFILACAMVGVGAVTPTYKEAQGLSSMFVILSIFPVYFITIIMSDPNGSIAQIFSYFPFTASFVLLFRNALNSLSLPEVIIGSGLILFYCYLGIYIAFKLFEIGSLEYNKKVGFKAIKSVFKNR